MSFGDAIKTCFHKYATFDGRASRAEYWWFALFYTIVYVVALVIDLAAGTTFVFILIVSLGLLLPTVAAGVRRLHDVGKSGWWYLIALIPFIGGIWLLVLCVQAGTPGQNQYGPPPQAVAA